MTLAGDTQRTPIYTRSRRLRVASVRGPDRRTGPAVRALEEHRTGFDRRLSYPLTGTLRDNPPALLGVLLAINVLSLLDLAFVLDSVRHAGGLVLADIISAGVGQAWLLKAAVMLAVSWMAWSGRHRRSALAGAVFALAASIGLVAFRLLIAAV